MFRHVQSLFEFSSALKTHHSFYSTLPQRLPTPVLTDGPRLGLVDDLPSVEEKSRKSRDNEDPSMSLYFLKGL